MSRRFNSNYVPPGGRSSISLSWEPVEEPEEPRRIPNQYQYQAPHQQYQLPPKQYQPLPQNYQPRPQQYQPPSQRAPAATASFPNFEDNYYAKQMNLLKRKQEEKFSSAYLEPAGAKSGEVTHADNYSEYQPFEQPLRTKRTAFPQYPSGGQNATSWTPSSHELEIQRVEAERRRREQDREEANLYQAVQPGNDLNRHVTGEVYAQQLMNDIADKRVKKEEERRRKIEEERRDEERVRRESAVLRGEVEGEIQNQRDRHTLVERRDEISRQQYESRLNEAERRRNGGEGTGVTLGSTGFSTSDYFEQRLSQPKNSHAARLQEMREKRWAMEKASGAARGREELENRNPQQMIVGMAHPGRPRREQIDLRWG
mmetsp:Transcript_13403/g.27353  ORF Transcript_13403/g.27353 Transcript_13403/m.27353 type:complete len:371 (+) Transcript_13403:92-1204(+)